MDRNYPMSRLCVGILVLAALAVTGCANSRIIARPAAGEWYGMTWGMCTEAAQGFEYLHFTVSDDGRWTAVIGARRAAGTVRLERGLVVFEGTVVGQPLVPVYYALAVAADGTLYDTTPPPPVLSSPPGKGTFPAILDLRTRR